MKFILLVIISSLFLISCTKCEECGYANQQGQVSNKVELCGKDLDDFKAEAQKQGSPVVCTTK